jgi:hypothetical protein
MNLTLSSSSSPFRPMEVITSSQLPGASPYVVPGLSEVGPVSGHKEDVCKLERCLKENEE